MYPRIIHRVFNSIWALEPAMMNTVLTLVHTRLAGEDFQGPALERERSESVEDVARTRIIFASGIVGKHLSAMEQMCAGGLSLDRLALELEDAASDPGVSDIVLWLDTPGGVVTGTPETASLIRSIAAVKPIVGYCDSLCASAGYWLLAGCDMIYATPSAELGSIGVYSALYDYSDWMAKEGVKLELFKAGDFKAMGLPGTQLTDGQRALLKDKVDAIYTEFTGWVAACRGTASTAREASTVDLATMQGQTFRGEAARAAGLCDAIVTGLDQVLDELAANRF